MRISHCTCSPLQFDLQVCKGRSIHALQFVKDSDGHSALRFKEWDSSGVEWTGRWDFPELPIKIFQSYSFPTSFSMHPRIRISNLKLVKEKWAAVAKFVKVDKPDKVLHGTAMRAHQWWLDLFAGEEEFWDGITEETCEPEYDFDWLCR